MFYYSKLFRTFQISLAGLHRKFLFQRQIFEVLKVIENLSYYSSLSVLQLLHPQDTMPLTSVIKKPPSHPRATEPIERVILNKSDLVRSTILRYRETGDQSIYVNAFLKLKASESLEEKLSWLSQMTECVSLLDRKADKVVLEFLVSGDQ